MGISTVQSAQYLAHNKCPVNAIKNIQVKVEGGKLGEREMDEKLCE